MGHYFLDRQYVPTGNSMVNNKPTKKLSCYSHNVASTHLSCSCVSVRCKPKLCLAACKSVSWIRIRSDPYFEIMSDLEPGDKIGDSTTK